MTVKEFKEHLEDMATTRVDLSMFSRFLSHGTREDKQLREELLVVWAVIRHRNLSDDDAIVIGGEPEDFDALLKGEKIEIVQALPDHEHENRRAIANGTVTDELWLKHANDHLQFPSAIIKAIALKHAKHYADKRTLVVAVDGIYTGEEDSIIEGWLPKIRKGTHRGTFKQVLLVERARYKTFTVF